MDSLQTPTLYLVFPGYRPHQSLLNRKGSDDRNNVAAVAGKVNRLFSHLNLNKRKVDVDSRAVRRGDDRHFGRCRRAATDAVDLPRVGALRSERRNEMRRPITLLVRKILSMYEESF